MELLLYLMLAKVNIATIILGRPCLVLTINCKQNGIGLSLIVPSFTSGFIYQGGPEVTWVFGLESRADCILA